MALKDNYVNGETLSASAFNEVATEVNANTDQLASGNFSSAVIATRLVSNVATGTAPLTVTSNTNVPNLNASLLNNLSANGTAIASSIAARDVNANLLARGFISGFTTTMTGAGTTTLTVASNPVQEFTGALAQTVVLPTTGVVAGQQYRIINNSTGSVLVQSSGLAAVVTLGANATTRVTSVVATPTTAAHWDADNGNASTLTGLPPTALGTASTIAARDSAANLVARGFIEGFLATALVAAGTTTLTNVSNPIQQFTGVTTQTVVLPTTSIVAGQRYTIINSSSGAVTVQSSALATIGAALTTGQSAEFIALVATPTTAANWHRR